jgi:hypothetical protein
MAEELLVKENLTKAAIDSGRELLRRLEDLGFRLDTAQWVLSSDLRRWRLLISSLDVAKHGPKKIYAEVEALLEREPRIPELSLHDITVVRPDDELVQSLRSVSPATRKERFEATRFREIRIGNQYIDEAYVYNLWEAGPQKYEHTEDIDEAGAIDAQVLNRALSNSVLTVANAFTSRQDLPRMFRSIIQSILQDFITTHKSIIILLTDQSHDMRLGGDALALAAQQVEKVFILSLLLDDPKRWTEAYIKDDFQRFYEYHLRTTMETGRLSRFEHFNFGTAPGYLEQMRQGAGVSDLEMQAIEFRVLRPKDNPPAHLRKARITPFPVPGNIRNLVKDELRKSLLKRWYVEYGFLYGYAHVRLSKVQLQELASENFAAHEDRERRELFFENTLMLPALWMSYLAAASSSTEVFRYTADHNEALSVLTTYWMTITETSLTGRALWNIHAKSIISEASRK